MTNALTWSGKTSVGHSHEAYFGSLPGRPEVMMVYGSFSRGERAWKVMFNDGSMRRPDIENHASLEAAQVYAQQCLSQPICERGYRSLAANAAMVATRLCDPCDSSADIAAAIAVAHEAYPDARVADIRQAMAKRFIAGSNKKAA